MPENRNIVFGEYVAAGGGAQFFLPGLGDNDSVEWAAMVHWQTARGIRMIRISRITAALTTIRFPGSARAFRSASAGDISAKLSGERPDKAAEALSSS